MKNLAALVSLSAIASLAVLAVVSVLGVCSPSWPVVSRIIGLSCAAGMLAIFVTDYAPRHSYNIGAAGRAVEAKRAHVPAPARPSVAAPTAGAMATLGLTSDPATVSMS